MIRIYRTINGELEQIDDFEKNCWIRMINPTKEEIEKISSQFSIEKDYLESALDNQETSRVEEDEDYGCSLIAVNVPIKSKENKLKTTKKHFWSPEKKIAAPNDFLYETLPVSIIETNFCVVTVCLQEIWQLQDFIDGCIKNVFTNLHTRFILQIIYHIMESYVFLIKQINNKSNEVERMLHETPKNQELYDMLDLEKSTVYFSTALKSNLLVIEKLERGRTIKIFDDDAELLEDIKIEIDQAVNMCSIYSNILDSTMNTFASVINNNVNDVMRTLTVITLLLSVPTLISSAYGMNVALPEPLNFWFIVGISIVLTIGVIYLLYKLKLLR